MKINTFISNNLYETINNDEFLTILKKIFVHVPNYINEINDIKDEMIQTLRNIIYICKNIKIISDYYKLSLVTKNFKYENFIIDDNFNQFINCIKYNDYNIIISNTYIIDLIKNYLKEINIKKKIYLHSNCNDDIEYIKLNAYLYFNN